jgi:hypothetical protein
MIYIKIEEFMDDWTTYFRVSLLKISRCWQNFRMLASRIVSSYVRSSWGIALIVNEMLPEEKCN